MTSSQLFSDRAFSIRLTAGRVDRRAHRSFQCVAILLGLVLLGNRAYAHDLSITIASLALQPDATYQLDLICDLDALALGLPPGKATDDDHRHLTNLPGEEQSKLTKALEELLLRRVRVKFDGVAVESTLSFPRVEGPDVEPFPVPPFFGITARLTGPVPEGARSVTFWASRAFGLISFRVQDAASRELLARTLKPGDESEPCDLAAPSAPESTGSVVWRYLVLGFEHILPKGVDHILFVLGLYLLSGSMRTLIWQVTAFTLAHSVTLGLSIYGVASLPSRLVESLIALSIAYVAIENTVTARMHVWRPMIVFGFGLLHGLGFASVLLDLGLPRGHYFTALVCFNVGVEVGQLAVISIAFLVTGWCRGRTWYRWRVSVPASALIAVVGLYWAVERAFG